MKLRILGYTEHRQDADGITIENDVLPMSTILIILAVAGLIMAGIWGGIGYGKAQATPLPRIDPFSESNKATAMQLTRISAETGVSYRTVFEIYRQNLSEVRTFDQQWNVSFATFHKLWQQGCFKADAGPCDREGPLLNGHTE